LSKISIVYLIVAFGYGALIILQKMQLTTLSSILAHPTPARVYIPNPKDIPPREKSK
jgi:hypothetical protein